MKSQIKTALSIVSLAVLVIAFQNCSPQKFSTVDSASSKVAGSTTPADGTAGDTPVAGTPGDGSTHHGGKCVEDDGADDSDYRNACAELIASKKTVTLADGVNIVNHSGAGRYIAGSFGNMDDNSGSMRIACSSAGGVLKSLDNDSGMTLVCGCNVGEIKNHSGKVVIVDGDVGTIQNSSGLIVVGGKVLGPIANNSGALQGPGGKY